MNSAFEDFPISNISSISYKSGMVLASIEVYASGNKATIKNVNKADAKEIADAIRAKLGRPAAATTVQAVSSDADELAKWARLRDSGVISAEDFEAKSVSFSGSERRVTTDSDLAGIAEIAERLGVARRTVSAWRYRHQRHPRPPWQPFPAPMMAVSGRPCGAGPM